MELIETARRLAELGNTEEAVRGYMIALDGELSPIERMEAAVYILENGGDYRLSYTAFVELHNAGQFREDTLSILTQAFYEPNVKPQKKRYERNCRALARYPYFFRKDFPSFDVLPLRFFPFDDHGGYVPYDTAAGRFREFVNPNEPVVSRNFFGDLEKPILAADVYSQYELEYLNDNIRPSEYIARENHLYLHYTDWEEFCAWLQVLDLRSLADAKKAVFLIGDEVSEYPIDFKERYGIDYSRYTPRPIGIREVNRMIWHAQLSTHCGGDFFNEIFDGHPNLLSWPSIMLEELADAVRSLRADLAGAQSLEAAQEIFGPVENPALIRDLYLLRNPTDKDLLVTLFLSHKDQMKCVDRNARIAPALFLQPHFARFLYDLKADEAGRAVLFSTGLDAIHNTRFFREFKYIKTFAPVRRFTTSHAAAVKFMEQSCDESVENGEDRTQVMIDMVT